MSDDKFLRIVDIIHHACIILALVMVMFFIIVIVINLLASATGNLETHTEDVNCYDKYGSKIKGVECVEEVYCSNWPLTFYGKCQGGGK